MQIQTSSLFYLNGTESLLMLLGTPVLTYLFQSKMAAVIKDSTFFTKAKKCKNMTYRSSTTLTALVINLHFCGTAKRRHDTSLLFLVDIETILAKLWRIAVCWKNDTSDDLALFHSSTVLYSHIKYKFPDPSHNYEPLLLLLLLSLTCKQPFRASSVIKTWFKG